MKHINNYINSICIVKLVSIGLLLLSQLIFSQEIEQKIKDIDGNTYRTIKIGEQIWMAENLKVTRYQNGDPIQEVVRRKIKWRNLLSGAYSFYNDDKGNINNYGYLYNWYAINDERKIAPEGWRIPNKDDWNKLISQIGKNSNHKLKSQCCWETGNETTEQLGFNAKPGGCRNNNGEYQFIKYSALFWTANESGFQTARAYAIYNNRIEVDNIKYYKSYGLSVRCIKDDK